MSSTFAARALLGVALTVTQTGFAQEGPAPAPAPQPQQPSPQPGPGTGPGNPTTGPGQPGQMPGQDRGQYPRDPRQTQQPFPEMQRMFFFSGKVMLDSGTPPPDPVVIERVCNGIARPEGYTDSKGRFSFQLGQNSAMMTDASVSSVDPFGEGFGGGRMGAPGMPGSRGINERDLMGCELRASLAGFRSDNVSLAGRRALDNPDVGTIVLHRLAKVDGFTFSATSAYASKDARKAYDKGREARKKQKWADAEKNLQKAITEHPKYAAAWFELGLAYQQQNKAEDARKAYGEALKADEKFVNPYAPLARMAAAEKKWEEAAELSGKLIRLNPYYSADAYFVSSVANLNLSRLDQAEEHAREAIKLDSQHRNPRMNHLLAVILQNKQDYAGAAASLKDYLKYAPQAEDTEKMKQQLAELESRMSRGQQGTTEAQ
ncbi:MAG TPA: tetratricopeptide repeat protein [Bryobacteraceae bacterium]|nr:tetratricopeptide repeat protein [Bryobacteraceae bacterium]